MFTRSHLNPILKPNTENPWEAKKLYNPGVVFHNGQYHLFYRAVGFGDDWKSSIGYAVSDDGENFIRHECPLLTGENGLEKRGLEDPRLTKIGDTFYMVYAAFDGITPRLCIATSQNLINWQKHGPALTDWKFENAGGIFILFKNGQPVILPNPYEWSKSGGIFPEKIKGKFLMMFGEYRIWFAESDNGLNWTAENTPFISPRQGDYFDDTFVEMGPPPIKTDHGWLVLYHGINSQFYYKIGFLLLDIKDPKKILYRSPEPIFEPFADYELTGTIDISHDTRPKVVFCNGAVVIDGLLKIYYGCGDTNIATASVSLDKLFKNVI
jgi:beta-1,2-mannobiose phosphorylase / 1,2-beta-oligomannan phosphorylase